MHNGPTSFHLLFPGCTPVLVAIRLQHGRCWICLEVQPESEVTDTPQETGAIHQKTQSTNQKRDNNRDSDDRLRDGMVTRVRLKSRRYRSACTRTHFSRHRFGSSHKSGTQEAQCLFSLPKRPKLRSMLANQDYKGFLQKTDSRSSTSSRKVW